MKTLKVSIQDENTLMLQEDGQKGDLIDLKSIHETDIDKTTISSVVKSIKMNEFNAQLQKELANVEKQKALEAQLESQKIKDQAKSELTQKEQEIAALNTKLEAIARQAEADAKLQAMQEQRQIEEKFRQ